MRDAGVGGGGAVGCGGWGEAGEGEVVGGYCVGDLVGGLAEFEGQGAWGWEKSGPAYDGSVFIHFAEEFS